MAVSVVTVHGDMQLHGWMRRAFALGEIEEASAAGAFLDAGANLDVDMWSDRPAGQLFAVEEGWWAASDVESGKLGSWQVGFGYEARRAEFPLGLVLACAERCLNDLGTWRLSAITVDAQASQIRDTREAHPSALPAPLPAGTAPTKATRVAILAKGRQPRNACAEAQSVLDAAAAMAPSAGSPGLEAPHGEPGWIVVADCRLGVPALDMSMATRLVRLGFGAARRSGLGGTLRVLID